MSKKNFSIKPSAKQMEAAIDAFLEGVYLTDEQVYASVASIVKAVLEVEANQELAKIPLGVLGPFLDASYDLSTWAACINWRGQKNELEWLEELREKIELVQSMTPKVRAAIASPMHRGRR